MKIIKITEGFVTNSSSYSGALVLAARKGKEFEMLLQKINLSDFRSRFYVLQKERLDIYIERIGYEWSDLLDEYDILEADVLVGAYGDDEANGMSPEGEQSELRDYIETQGNSSKRKRLVGDDLILLLSSF